MEDRELTWHKATASGGNGGNCVEVAATEDAVLVRDSKDRKGPVLRFTSAEWAAFLDGVRQGEFDEHPG